MCVSRYTHQECRVGDIKHILGVNGITLNLIILITSHLSLRGSLHSYSFCVQTEMFTHPCRFYVFCCFFVRI